MAIMMCPHCGREYSQRACRPLIPAHDYPPTCGSVCPGSGQTPRNAESDRRPLWKDENQPIEDVPINFGLQAQGHIPTIERMLAVGQTWEEIGKAINWCPQTARKHYEMATKGGE